MRRRFAALTVLASMLAAADAWAEGDDLSLDLGGAPLELRRVPKGTFMQGSPASEPGHDKDEEGPRPVTISHDVWMSKMPVTRGQFGRFVTDTRYVTEAEKGNGGYGFDGKGMVQKKEFTWRSAGFPQAEDHPVVLVTYGDAVAFAAWASRKTAKRVRLPTEAEYEYATRAGTTTPWYGAKTEEEALAIGWFRQNAGAGTRPVGQKRPNAFGLFDMSGDVYEWCRDVYVPGYPRDPAVDPEIAARTDTEPERRVLRGGSWFKDPKRGRSAARFRSAPGSRSADIGFRVVVTEDDAIAPGLAAGGGFPTASPIGAASGSASPVITLPDGGTEAITDPRPTGELTWLLFAGPAAAAAAAVAWMLVRKRDVAGAHARAVDEGFFVRVAGAAAGTRVHYTCFVDGASFEGETTVSGDDETFVRTRVRPADVRVRELAPEPPRAQRLAQALRRPTPLSTLEPPPESSRAPRTEPLPKIEPISEPAPKTQPLPKIEPEPLPLVVPTPQSPLGELGPQKAPIVESSTKLPVAPSASRLVAQPPPSSGKIPPSPPSSGKIPPSPPSSGKVPPSPPSSRPGDEAKRVPPPVPSAPRVPAAEPSSRVPPSLPSAPKVAVAEEAKPPAPASSRPDAANVLHAADTRAGETTEPLIPPGARPPVPAPAASAPAPPAPPIAAWSAPAPIGGAPMAPASSAPIAPMAPASSAPSPTPAGVAPTSSAPVASAPAGTASASAAAPSAPAATASAPAATASAPAATASAPAATASAPAAAAAASAATDAAPGAVASPAPAPVAAASSIPATAKPPATVQSPVGPPASPPSQRPEAPRPSETPASEGPATIAAPPPVPSAPPAAPHPSPSSQAPATLGSPPAAESSQVPPTVVSPPIVSPSSMPHRRDSSPPSESSPRASRPMLYTPAEKVDDEPPDSAPSLAQLVASHSPEPSAASERPAKPPVPKSKPAVELDESELEDEDDKKKDD